MYLEYVALTPAPPTAPAFCYLDAAGELRPLLYTTLAEGIKWLVSAIGCDPSQYASHSLRRGGATSAIKAGTPPLLVQLAGDWASASAFQLYVQLGAAEKLACTAAMLSLLSSP